MNTIKHLFAILALLCVPALAVLAKEFQRPDYNAIKLAIENEQSAYYYPRLFERYVANDTTLMRDEYKYLYYGYFFKETDSLPEKVDELQKEIRAVTDKDSPTVEELHTLIGLSERYLKAAPFDLRTIDRIYRSYKQLGDSVTARKYYVRAARIISTILSTGDGKTEKTGYHVLEIPHEYFILSVLGLGYGGSQSLIGNCDYLKVQQNDENIQGVYFDVSQMFEVRYKKMFGNAGLDFLDDTKGKKKKRKK